MTGKRSRWGTGSGQYQNRPDISGPDNSDADRVSPKTFSSDRQIVDDRSAATGITWNSDALNLSAFTQMEPRRALARFRARIVGHVWDAAALEGNPITLPEVQTLLEGITVQGRKLTDEQQVLALAESTNFVADLVERNEFELAKAISDRIHHLVAQHEAIEAGHFRGEGSVNGGGLVRLGELGDYQASAPGEGGKTLIAEYDSAVEYLKNEVAHPAERAMAYFMTAAYRQFYFDGNKRTARLNMNGHLLANGHDAISIPAARRLEFNEHLRRLFYEANGTDLIAFITDCLPKD